MDDIVNEAKELRKESIAYNNESRENGKADVQFELGGEFAWDDKVWSDRGDRPKVTINTISVRKHRLANDLRDLNPEIKVIPKSEDGERQAEIRNKLIKDIQDKSCAESIYDACFCQGLSSGFAAMLAKTQFAAPDSFDQDIRLHNLQNNLAVHWDYTHKNPAYLDMKWGMYEGKMSMKDYVKKFPDRSEGSFESDAYQDDVSEKSIILNHYYRIIEQPKKLVLLSNGRGGLLEGYIDDLKIADAIEAEIDGQRVWEVIQERKSYKSVLERYLMNGTEVLEDEKGMLGNYIPIIPYEGRMLLVNGRKHLISFIRNLKEPSRLKNYAKSLEVELVALQPLATWSAPMEGISDYFDFYQSANEKRWPILPYEHKDKDGEPIPAPVMTNWQGPSNQLAGTFQTYDKDLNDVSGMYEDNIGGPSALRAGVAIDLKQSQGNHNNYDFIDNFITRTLTYAGIVLNDLITETHDTEREVYINDGEGKPERILLNQPDEKGEMIDMREGSFEVKTVVGAASETQRRETNELLMGLLEKIPAMQNTAHLIAKNLDNVQDKDEIVKILKASLPPEVLSLTERDEQTVGMENAQLKQQLEMITQQYEQAEELIKSMQIDYKKAMDVQTLKSQTDLEKASIQSATTLTKQEMENQKSMIESVVNGFQELKEQIAGMANGTTLTTEGQSDGRTPGSTG